MLEKITKQANNLKLKAKCTSVAVLTAVKDYALSCALGIDTSFGEYWNEHMSSAEERYRRSTGK